MNIESIFPIIILALIFFSGYTISKFIYDKTKEKKYEKEFLKSGIKDIDRMDGFQFEVYLKVLFKELGYKTTVTKSSNDFGADLILKKNNKKIAIQAKRYKYKNTVGINAVQQIYASMPYYKVNKGIVITNSYFTKNAKILARHCNIKLIDRKGLVKLISRNNQTITPKKIKNTVAPKPRKCPVCKNPLTVRYNKTGEDFFGCSQYPTCKHTEPIAN